MDANKTVAGMLTTFYDERAIQFRYDIRLDDTRTSYCSI